jgi:4-amino-4-deoxy-L-arabinose transferase-like glycosyltransferase
VHAQPDALRLRSLFESRRELPAWLYLVFAILLLAVWFGPLEYRKLVKHDEGRYAEIPREMAVSGDWITPRLNGIKYFEKPPLQYWMTAAAYRAFGEHHWTARLWTALTGFLSLIVVWRTGRRLYGEPAGLFCALALAGCIYYSALGHINTLDMGLTFFAAVALCSFLIAQQAPPESAPRWMMVSWAACALGVLSKGLIALVLPALALTVYSLVQRDFSPWRRLSVLRGIAILLAIAGPWFVAVSLVNPEFPRFFFIHEHFERYLTTVHHRVEPWWFFIPLFIAGLLPWLSVVPGAIRVRDEASAPGAFSASRFLLIYALSVVAFFSLSGSKLPSYIGPAFPACALLIGAQLARLEPKAMKWHALPLLVLSAALALGTPLAAHLFPPREPAAGPLYAAFAQSIQGAGVVGIAASLVAFWLARSGRRVSAVTSLAGGALLVVQLVMAGHDRLNALTSAYGIAHQIAPRIDIVTPFYAVRTYDQTLTFYLRRTMTLVEYGDEFIFGLQQEPQLQIATLDRFREVWKESDQAFALMGPDTYSLLSNEKLPMRLVARDPRRIVVARR